VGSRYLLLETVRAFALDELTAHGEQQAAARAVVSYGVSLAGRLGRELCGPGEAAADARLRRELPNLRAAFRTALAQGVWKAAVDIVVDLDEAALWRVMPDLHDWAMELATRPDVSELPRAAEVLGTAARAAWQRGELDAAQRLVDHALRLATNDVEATRAIDVIGTLALFGGDLGLARESYLAAAAGRPDYASLPTSAALAAIYAGERQEAERLLERAEELAREGHSLTDRAYYLYARGELEAQHDPVAALQAYGEAIELARESGAGFVEGIASVGLVRLWTSTGQIDQALHGFRWLLEHWRRGGSWIQQWTTLRNLAYLLIEVGDHGTAALLLAAAAR